MSKVLSPGERRNRELNYGRPAGWQDTKPVITQHPNGVPPSPILYAIISTWFDSDIVEASVANCFRQGCQRVYILDNDSPDDTVKRAEGAGATVAQVYSTEVYDDDLRNRLQNDFVRSIVETEKRPNLWWLLLDVDEFAHGPDGVILLDYLSHLSPKINTIGADFIDLYPSSPNQYAIGQHPALSMGMGSWRRGGYNKYCSQHHWKHPLVRYEYGNWNVATGRGNHVVATDRRVGTFTVEPPTTLVFFHAPLRQQENAVARLTALVASGRSVWDDQVTRNQGAIKRWNSLNHIYSQQWRKVEIPHTQLYGRAVTGLALYPWRTLVPTLADKF